MQAALETPGAVVVEGEFKIGGQEHFYLEPNATLAIPGEVRAPPPSSSKDRSIDRSTRSACWSAQPPIIHPISYPSNSQHPRRRQDGALEVWASTQNPTKTQNFCAYVCGVPANQVRQRERGWME